MKRNKIGILRPMMTAAQIATLEHAADQYHRLSIPRKGGRVTARFVADGREREIKINTDGTIEGDAKWVKPAQPEQTFMSKQTNEAPQQKTTEAAPPRTTTVAAPLLSREMIQARFQM